MFHTIFPGGSLPAGCAMSNMPPTSVTPLRSMPGQAPMGATPSVKTSDSTFHTSTPVSLSNQHRAITGAMPTQMMGQPRQVSPNPLTRLPGTPMAGSNIPYGIPLAGGRLPVQPPIPSPNPMFVQQMMQSGMSPAAAATQARGRYMFGYLQMGFHAGAVLSLNLSAPSLHP